MSDDTTTPAARDDRALVRYVAAGVVIAAFIALAGLAIAASRSSFSIGSLGLPAAAHHAPATQTTAAAPLPDVPNLAAFSHPDTSSTDAVSAGVTTLAAPMPATATDDQASPATPTTLPPPPALAPASVAPKACPALGLPAPTDVGGLQSLIALVPLFGSFSPEAFALMPAFEPGFSALGPLFPLFEQGLGQASPVLTAITPAVQQLEAAGLSALAPLYGGERTAVLAAEKQLAAQLAPIVQQLANAPGSECLVALEGVLASAADPSGS